MTRDAARQPRSRSRQPCRPRRLATLARHIPARFRDPLMYWSIWCNERWVGLDARGPWGTYLDGYVASQLESSRRRVRTCRITPSRHRTSRASARRCRCSRSSAAPTRRIRPEHRRAGTAMPKARVVVLPEHGHGVGQYGCLPSLVALFVDRGSAATLDVRCVRSTKPPGAVSRLPGASSRASWARPQRDAQTCAGTGTSTRWASSTSRFE